MVNAKVNLLVDLLMVITLILVYIYPGKNDLHSTFGIALGVLVGIHLILHWRYIINIPKLFKN